jgi:IS1 family transposase/transposase-like protein
MQKQCPHCNGRLIKFGFLKKEKTQRYQCKECKRTTSDLDKRCFGTLRTDRKKIILVTTLLTEGMGIRGAARVASCHRDTVLRILKLAGEKSKRLLESKLKGLALNYAEADEIHTTVLKKYQFDERRDSFKCNFGDYYIYLGIEADTKLLLLPTIGRRSQFHTEKFADSLRKCTDGRFQLTTDGFRSYKSAVPNSFGNQIDFAQLWKELHMVNAVRAKRNAKHTPKKVYAVRCGEPEKSRITTAHVERVNLSMRHFNKRFARKSQCFSKLVEYLEHSVYLFVAHYNFCKLHKGILGKQTPAMAQGIEKRALKTEELFSHF